MDARILQNPIHHLKPAEAGCVDAELPVVDLIFKMQEVTPQHTRGMGAVLVTQDSELVGIITERDLIRRVVSPNKDINKTVVSQVMTNQPETLTKEDPIVFALNLMHLGHYRHVPLVDDENSPVGVITSKNIAQYISQFMVTA